MTFRPYHSLEVTNKVTQGTLLSSTFKIEESNQTKCLNFGTEIWLLCHPEGTNGKYKVFCPLMCQYDIFSRDILAVWSPYCTGWFIMIDQQYWLFAQSIWHYVSQNGCERLDILMFGFLNYQIYLQEWLMSAMLEFG